MVQINPIAYKTGTQATKNNKGTNNGSFINSLRGSVEKEPGHKVYLKQDDMLYSGGNGTGLSFYLKYAEGSTVEEPRILAKGVDENGNDFEQVIDVNKVNPKNATIVEMRALEAVSDAPKRNGYSSLPMGSTNVGLNERQDYIEAFKSDIRDMNTLGEYGIAFEYNKALDFYEKYVPKSENIEAAQIDEKTANVTSDKPLWHWHDGQFGYSAEVYKNDNCESEYTVKLKYDDGREKVYVVDADKIDPSNCNITDLSVKMYHLEAEGKIDNAASQILLAHVYMRYRTPNADENTMMNYLSWYERQLDLEMKNGGSEKNIKNLLELVKNLTTDEHDKKNGLEPFSNILEAPVDGFNAGGMVHERAVENVGIIGHNAPESVKQAWIDAADQTGTNGVSVTVDGKHFHLPQMLVEQLNRTFWGGGSPKDILGNTVESAISAAKKAIYDIDNPLPGQPERSAEVKKEVEKERDFYLAFIERLERIEEG